MGNRPLPTIGWIGPLAAPTLDDARARRAADALLPTPYRGRARATAILCLYLLTFCAIWLHEPASTGSLPTRAAVARGNQTSPIGSGVPEMRHMRSLMAGVVGVGMVATGAAAQGDCPLTWSDTGHSVSLPPLMVWYGPGAQFLDANGDGVKDVVFSSAPVKCRLGIGGGEFGPEVTSEPAGWREGNCVGDINQDGKDDFVAQDYFAGRARVMLSLGNGSFSQSQALVTGSYCTTCRLGDMDGDGDLDLVVGTELEGFLKIFINNGQGVFTSDVTLPNAGQYHREMKLVDLDLDGDLEIVVQNEWLHTTIRIFQNNGGLSFTQMPSLSYPGGGLSIAPVDFDRDGDIDLAASVQSGELRVYVRGGAPFQFDTLSLGQISNSACVLTAVDLSFDGIDDLFLSDDSGRYGVMLGNATGGFGSPSWTPTPGKNRFKLIDFDNDGDLDIAAGFQSAESPGDLAFLARTCESTIVVPTQFPTIQAAIDSVPAGAARVVSVLPGTYNQSFALNGKDIVVRGAPGNATIIDGTGLATSVVRFTGGEPATAGIENLVIRNGTVGSLIVPNATFRVGGGLYAANSSAFVKDCRFESNAADFGGGAYLFRSSTSVDGCVFVSNTAFSESGGLQLFESSGPIMNSTFDSNSANPVGAGAASALKVVGARTQGGVVLVSNCTIENGDGGTDTSAVEMAENASSGGLAGVLRISNTVITGNAASTGAGGLRVIGSQDSCVLADGTSICSNTPRNVLGPFLIEGKATVCDCLADLTLDGAVNGADLGVVLAAWGAAASNGAGDANHDGVVDGADLASVLASWGACP